MGRDAPLLTCPFCDASDIEDVAQFGGQLITRQARCRACNTYFEVVREDFDARPAPVEPPLPPAA